MPEQGSAPPPPQPTTPPVHNNDRGDIAQNHYTAATQWHNNQGPLPLQWPAQIVSKHDGDTTAKNIRTDSDLINWKLLEHGLTFDDYQDIHRVQHALQNFRADLLRSQCYHDVQVNVINQDKPEATSLGMARSNISNTLQVLLDEKNWYRLYVGGGIKQPGFGDTTPFTLDKAPSVHMESSIGLVNLSGCLDNSTLQYTVDQNSLSNWNLVHERPLYTIFPKYNSQSNYYSKHLGLGWMRDRILLQPKGTQYSLSMRAALETMDYEYTRSYKEFHRLVSLRIANQNAQRPELASSSSPTYTSLEWSLLFRDLIPRRLHRQQATDATDVGATAPTTTSRYALDASPEIACQAGPSLKHSLQWEYRRSINMNNMFNPTRGSNIHLKAELATPPGDVGFWKVQGGWSTHHPITLFAGTNVTNNHDDVTNDRLCWHASFSSGILQPLLFGGMCNPPTVSDRFFCGGPLQLRGFLPSGIGPRSNNHQNPIVGNGGGEAVTSIRGSSLTPNGDSLGGDFFYIATLATSVGFGGLHQASFLRDHVRCFAFVNFGTLTGLHNNNLVATLPTTLLQSSRVAVGAGCCVATGVGRLELTYSVPLRYSPRDARRAFQFGLGFTFE